MSEQPRSKFPSSSRSPTKQSSIVHLQPPIIYAQDIISTESKSSLNSAEYDSDDDDDFDYEPIQKSNEALKSTTVCNAFWEKVNSIEPLDLGSSRRVLGKLPMIFPCTAIPLFTDENGTDFQIQLSPSTMGVVHTANTTNADIIDPNVFQLLYEIPRHEFRIIENPRFVIPLGQLYIHKSGRSHWTGYEVFINEKLEVWIVYLLTTFDPYERFPEKVRQAWHEIPGSREEEDDDSDPPRVMTAQLWESLKTLRHATAEEVAEHVRMTRTTHWVGHFYLLELSANVVMRVFSSPDKYLHTVYSTPGFSVSAASNVGKELLRLAYDYKKRIPLMMITFERTARETPDVPGQDLLWYAAKYGEKEIIKALRERR